MEPTRSGAQRVGDVVVVLGFVLLIALIPCLAFFRPAQASSIAREFRKPAPPPQRPTDLASWSAWPRAFDAWFSDHFGLRANFIRWHNVIAIYAFDVSPTTEIVLGPGRSMFTTRDRAVDVFRGADPFTQRELELWMQVLEDRRAWCKQRGIAYVFAIAPNKETIYPEQMPERFDRVGPTRREQLIEFARTRSDFPLLDLTDTLKQCKLDFRGQGDVYFPLGTHWDDRGAMYAYLALIERAAKILPGIKTRTRDEFKFVHTDVQGDSWAGRLYMENELRQDNVEIRFARAISAQFWSDREAEKAFIIDTEHPDKSLPRAVMFHDSMGEKLRPMIAEHFSHVAFRWVADFDPAVIEQEHPDIVIQLFVERALAAFSLSTSPLDTQERCEREFGASSQVLYQGLDGLTPALPRDAQGALRVSYDGQPLYVPELRVPPSTWAVLRFELDAPVATTLLVEFLTPRFHLYSRLARGVQLPLHPGHNVVYVKLRVPELSGRVRFHPGTTPGDYVLRSLAVRAVPE